MVLLNHLKIDLYNYIKIDAMRTAHSYTSRHAAPFPHHLLHLKEVFSLRGP